MSKYLYSAKTNAFYPFSSEDSYRATGVWPDSGVDVDEETFTEFTSEPPDGKIRGGNSEGYPCWMDISPPTREQLIAEAESKKAALLSKAQETISFWQTELQLGIISDEDKASLIAWMQYIKAVQAVDTSTTPNITWPNQPDM